jgi:hypothetical protein
MTRPELHMPTGWLRAGSAPDRYDMGVARAGGPALIRSRDDVPSDKFGTLMQSFVADRYRGRRLRLRAELRTEAVTGAGTIWMRVDGGGKRLGFDNMESRSRDGVLSETRDWTPREIVLDVPEAAESIHFGFFLRGTGTTYLRNVDLAEVGMDVATTAMAGLLPEPTNLDFTRLADRD